MVQLLRLRVTLHTLPLLFCAHKFQGRTYAEITRQWKSTISLVFMNVKNYPHFQYVNVVNGEKMFTCLRFLP